ncbi:MAG TPA: hypothetical protein VGD91_31135 [Trebonia sp.]
MRTRFSPRRRGGQPPRRFRSRRALAAGLGAAGLAFAAGCSVAPAGAATDSPAIGPVRSSSGPADFAPFPVPAIWNGDHNRVYQMVLKAKTGSVSPHKFHLVFKSDMVFWLSCIGAGRAQIASPGIGLKWSVACGDGGSPAGINFSPASSHVGHSGLVDLTVSAGCRWEIRVDAVAPPGVTPAPAPVPSQ